MSKQAGEYSAVPTPPSTALPVFYDARQRRWTHTKQILPIVLLAIAAIGTGFVLSLLSAPFIGRAPGVHRLQHLNVVHPVTEPPERVRARFDYRQISDRLRRYLAEHRGRKREDSKHFWRPTAKPYSIVAGFYVNWEAGSFASFERHAKELTHIIPEWLRLGADGAAVNTEEDPQNQFPRLLELARQNHVAVLPLINNYHSGTGNQEGRFDPARVHRLLISPARRATLINILHGFVKNNGCQGINVDFEMLPPADQPAFASWIDQLSRVFRKDGLLVTVDVEVDNSGGRFLQDMAASADYLIPMLYDEHSLGDEAGPVASQAWFKSRMETFFSQVPPSRTILGIGNYAIDWAQGSKKAEELSVGAAIVRAKESLEPGDSVQMDHETLNSHFSYYDDNDKPRDVWMLDALSAYNEIQVSRPWAPAGAALWVIGEEDRSLWSFFAEGRLGKTVDPYRALSNIRLDYEVDAIGEGECLRVSAAESVGQREVTVDAKTGLVRGERYLSYPMPYVVHGFPLKRPRKVLALTFDDGPDGRYTPEILDVLARFHVPATFFVIGDNASRYPDVVEREWREGHEIGNHTFFHPNLSLISVKHIRYEIEATERLLEVLIGHDSLLFRAPYEVDTDPNTPDELRPLLEVGRMGMMTVGANIDPKDYMRGSTPEKITADVMSQLGSGNVILMHDAGGPREATVQALTALIPKLQAKGYRFVTITQLLSPPGKEAATRAFYFPTTGESIWGHTSDYVAFLLYFWVRRVLGSLFALAILAGLLRVMALLVLALVHAARENSVSPDSAPNVPVSVLVAAFNEEKVIARTVEAILASDYPNLEVIVVDDGSVDRTSEIVRHFFVGSRVKLLRTTNGGKAAALNTGLQQATGEVIVGIDADTILAPDAIRRLAAHFEDPRVAGVAGNVKVGNPVNILTRWQSLEYVTSQNFDRRAYDILNCITVVPGAIGAWRRSALLEAGGYGGDTLAEDTDLTFRVRRLGGRIRSDSRAVAYTEAPEDLSSFTRQRFRWIFGTLQCLWKHRDAIGRPRFGTFGLIALPVQWFYGVLIPLISPVMDLMIILSLFDFQNSFARTAFYYALFFLAELVAAMTALMLDGEKPGLAFWLFFQRFFYRQIMYSIAWKAVLRAWTGGIQGWSKLARTGTVISPRSPSGPVPRTEETVESLPRR